MAANNMINCANKDLGRSYAEDAPSDVLRKCFSYLPAKTLASCICVCQRWKGPASADALWEPLYRQRWKLWNEGPCEQDSWRSIYAERDQLESDVAHLIAGLADPQQRSRNLKNLSCFANFNEVQDAIQRVASTSWESNMGQRYWGSLARRHVAIQHGPKVLAALCTQQDGLPPEQRQLEKVALVVESTLYDDVDMALFERKIDRLAQELKRRMAAAHVRGGLKALELLSQLLFGEPPPGRARGLSWGTEVSEEQHQQQDIQLGDNAGEQDVPADDMEWEALVHMNDIDDEEYVPPNGYGLGLKGNDKDLKIKPRGLLISEVLLRGDGVSMCLSMLHAAVGRRAGLKIQCAKSTSGSNFVTVMRPPDVEMEVFVDTYARGRLARRDEMESIFAGVEGDWRVKIASAEDTYLSLCSELVDMYNRVDDFQRLRWALELALPLHENRNHRLMHAQICAHLGDFDAALHDFKQLLRGAFVSGVGSSAGPPTDDPLLDWEKLLDLFNHTALQRIDVEGYRPFRTYILKAMELKEDDEEGWSRVMWREQHPTVQYRVGDVIRHRKHNRVGVIIGWDECCKQSDEWIAEYQVDKLPGGCGQPFYTVVMLNMQDNSMRYVAQDYVEQMQLEQRLPSSEEASLQLGEYFSLYDGAQMRYIPNAYLRRTYPQDV